MKTKVLWALVALNVMLVVGLLSPLGHSAAQAQQGPAAHAGDHFLMLSAEVNGAPSAMVFIIDENTNQLSARIYDDTPRARTFIDMPPLDLTRIYAAGPGAGRP